MQIMKFYLLNCGYFYDLSKQRLQNGIEERLKPLVRKGGRLPCPFGDFEVEVGHAQGGALFTLSRTRRPICISGVAWTKAGSTELWTTLDGLYLSLSDQFPRLMAAEHVPSEPTSLPWIAALLVPGFHLFADESLSWLIDFERCFGWSILDERSLPTV